MIAQEYRFHGHGSLKYLFKNGDATKGQGMLLRHVVNKRRDGSRLAVVVSKKVAKSAVTRNRIRRRLYEAVRKNWARIPKQQDIAIIVFDGDFALISGVVAEKRVVDVLTRAGLYQPLD